jgi:glycine/D-amino acid oxidase-like deaminating enzyme
MTGRHHGIVVLGAGLTGMGVALSLARRGLAVTLLDQDALAFNRASLRNEGKIHLGFIYANDTTFATARLQLTGALKFRSLLGQWIGDSIDTLALSTPFIYLATRNSLLDPHQLECHYEAVEQEYRALMRDDPAREYLGARPERLYAGCRLASLAGVLDTSELAAAWRTGERAIDTDELAVLLRRALSGNERVTFLPRHKLEGIARVNGGFELEGSAPGGAWRLSAGQVVNALWEQRLRFDQMVGLPRRPGWVYRLKYRVIARLPADLHAGPSATMVLGPYGDVVVRANGTAYLSWYPAGLQGWSQAEAPPDAWDAPCRGEVDETQANALAHRIVAGIGAWYPAIGRSRPLRVDAGAIVAYGSSDIDHPGSGLHDRSRIGVTSQDGYHSIDPGKLTTAPLFAEEAAARVIAR